MSKELTPLEAWERANNNTYEHGYEISGDLCYIIETALERLETLEEDFKSLTETNMELVKEQARNRKKLKALDIIKEKGVAVGMLQLKEVGLKEYNDFIGDKKLYLTQEEFDLLKEVLE